MTTLDALKYVGIEAPAFIAGASGAITFLSKPNKMSYTQRFLVVLSGGLAANYIPPLLNEFIHFGDNVRGGVCFIVGYAGLKGVELLIGVFKKRAQQ
jgi:hypothetical protein